MPVAYQFTVKLRTDIKGVLRSSFLAGSAFLLFFTGFAVGFMILFILLATLGRLRAIRAPKRVLTCLTQIKPLKAKFAVRFTLYPCWTRKFSRSLLNYSIHTFLPGLAPLLAVKIHSLLL